MDTGTFDNGSALHDPVNASTHGCQSPLAIYLSKIHQQDSDLILPRSSGRFRYALKTRTKVFSEVVTNFWAK